MSFSELLIRAQDILNYKLFSLSHTDVTLLSLVLFVLIFLAFFVTGRILSRRILARMLDRFQVEEGVRYTIQRITEYLVIVIGAIVALTNIGINLGGLAVIFGLLSVGIGFGLQNVTSNFIAGLIMLFERPVKVGDRVTVGDIEGDVMDINIRSTTIRSLNNISIIVPNSEFISAKVVNWSHRDPKVRLDIDVGVSYHSDLDRVIKALKSAAEGIDEVLVNPAPEVLLMGFGDSSWNMRLRVWISDPKKHWIVQSAVNCAIVHAFRSHGVEIPFPQRDLHLRSPLPLPLETNHEG